MPETTDLLAILSEVTHRALSSDPHAQPLSVPVLPTELRAVCERLKHDPNLYFDMLSCITGIDNGPGAGTLDVIYTFYSIPNNIHLSVRVSTARDSAEVPTVSDLWKSADWLEREVFDMYGVRFAGHPDLRRILLPADWEGHPLRKDYTHQEYYRGVTVAFNNQYE